MSVTNTHKNCPLKCTQIDKDVTKSSSNELENIVSENERLENENLILKSQILTLKCENDNLSKSIFNDRKKFEEDFRKLIEQVEINQNNLIINTRKSVQDQKAYMTEIETLKLENDQLKIEKQKIENDAVEKLKSLQSQMMLLELENGNLKAENTNQDSKTEKYRVKLKQAVKLVNELKSNGQLIKPKVNCESIQTDPIFPRENKTVYTQYENLEYKRSIKSENLLLSDIFFKPKSFGEISELDLFNYKSKAKWSS